MLARVEEENVEFIRFWFTDIFGQLKSFAVGREELAGALEDGMGFDGSSITGFNRIEESDMIAMPDPSTFRILPWRTGETHKVGRLFCDVLKPGGEPYEGDPRFVMRRALARARDMGFDHYYLGPELEFFLFKSDTAPEVLDRGGYFDLTTLDVGSDFRRDAVFTLRELGIPVEYTHHEVGPSQHEIDMRFADGLDMADNAMTYRIAIKEVAAQHGFYATFMPKPLHGENGSGMHTHQSLFRGSDNAFFDSEDEFYLSDVAKSFIAGQLKHARELAALFAPSVNSYKRLVPGYEAPVYIGLVAPQPLGARAGAAVPPGQGAGHADGAPLPGSVVQPLPHVRGAAAGGPGGNRAGLRPARPDRAQPLRPHRGGAPGHGRSAPARVARGGDRGDGGLGSWSSRRSAATSSTATSR